MNKFFNRLICLLGESKFCIPIFKKPEDLEYFQLKLGLGALCQNTLIYQTINKDEQRIYETNPSPHADQFYSDDCLLFKEADKSCNSNLCHDLQESITQYFCEPGDISLPDNLVYQLLEYPYSTQQNDGKNKENMGWRNLYIQYQCPYVDCIKYGFPIYVDGQAIAVIFVGQFFLKQTQKKEMTQGGIWPFFRYFKLGNINPPNSFDSHPSPMKNRTFSSMEKVKEFVEGTILPIVQEFIATAQQNYEVRQIEMLAQSVDDASRKLERSFLPFINQISGSIIQGNYQKVSVEWFCATVRKSLEHLLEKIEIHSFYLFMTLPSGTLTSPNDLEGIPIYNKSTPRSKISFQMEDARNAMTKDSIAYSTDINQDKSNMYLFQYVKSDESFSKNRRELLANMSAFPPFALVYEFCDKSKIAKNAFLRYHILKQLERYFLKVGQLLTPLSIKISEYNTISILRIYRHEITHQILALNQNLWELEPSHFKNLNENKLELIIADYTQCLAELDFMTQNMDVITGRIKGKAVNYDYNNKIGVSSQIFNKSISLNQSAKENKTLWFSIKNNSRDKYFVGCLELVDLIFFNLMSNATKYAYEGTNLILGFDDSPYHGRPHILSVTDFGCGIQTDWQEQIFQLYYRENRHEATEGSGIGLYVSQKVAELIGTTITWSCDLISEYHIPSLARFLEISKYDQDLASTEVALAEAEYRRLEQKGLWNKILNKDYLLDSSNWVESEIVGRLKLKTFKVTFAINL